MNLRNFIAKLLVAALVLPIALTVLWGAGHMLAAMGDALWAGILFRASLVGSLLWGISLICLLVALAVQAVASDGSSDDSAKS